MGPDGRLGRVLSAACRTKAGSIVLAIEEGTHVDILAKDLANGHTAGLEGLLFEIGSVTKTFVATVLADLVTQGALDLDAPIGKLLPPQVAGPRDMTLRALASHTSGLSREPSPMWLWKSRRSGPASRGSQRRPTTVEELYEALAVAELSRPGSYHYSNFGYMLLGHVLSLATSQPLAQQTKERIFLPLEMASTAFVDDLGGFDVAQGYRADSGEPVPLEHQLPGPAGICSTAADLTKWTAAWLFPPPHLERAMALALMPQHRRSMRRHAVGLAWRIEDDGLVWHTGGTGGFTTFCGFHRSRRSSLVVLINAGLGALDVTPASIPIVIRFLRVRRAAMKLARRSP